MAFSSSQVATSGATFVAGLTVNAPTHSSGDIILLHFAKNSYNATTITWPSGFTQLAAWSIGENLTGVAWKRAGGSEPGTYAVSANGDDETAVLFSSSYSGRHGSNNPVAGSTYAVTNQAAPLSLAVPGVTAVADDDIAWFGVGNGVQSLISFTPPSSYTERQDSGLLNAWLGASLATRDAVSAGATGTVTGTTTNGDTNNMNGGGLLVRIPASGVTNATATISGAAATAGAGSIFVIGAPAPPYTLTRVTG